MQPAESDRLLPQPGGADSRIMPIEDLIAKRSRSEEWKQINDADRLIAQCPQVKMPLYHLFGPGWYARSIFIPADTIATTLIHRQEHPFVVSLGNVSVWTDEDRWEHLFAPHIGVTKPGTRRLLYAHTDVIWHTFHVTNETDLKKLVDELTFDPVKLGHLNELTSEQLDALREHANPANR